jgi:uncharacterized protein HemX
MANLINEPTEPEEKPATKKGGVSMVAPTESEIGLARVLIASYVALMLGAVPFSFTAFDGLETELRLVLGVAIVSMVLLLAVGSWRGAQATVAEKIPEGPSNGFNQMAVCGLLGLIAGLVVLGISIFSYVSVGSKLDTKFATLEEKLRSSSARINKMEIELTATTKALSDAKSEFVTRTRELEEQINRVSSYEENVTGCE